MSSKEKDRYPGLDAHLKAGTLVPTDTILEILDGLIGRSLLHDVIFIDGFPRKLDQTTRVSDLMRMLQLWTNYGV